jgi:hypothetical protein
MLLTTSIPHISFVECLYKLVMKKTIRTISLLTKESKYIREFIASEMQKEALDLNNG